MSEKRFILILLLLVIIGSCISADEYEKEKRRLAAVRASSPEYSQVCYTIEHDGCEYIYCHWQQCSNSSKASIAITPKLNQKNPEKCNLGNMRY